MIVTRRPASLDHRVDRVGQETGARRHPTVCSGSRPGNYITASVLVNLPSSTGLKGVQATLTGPVTDTMSCQPYGMASVCTWSNTAPVTAGGYLLQISAPGFQAMTFQVQVAVPRPSCQCVGASIDACHLLAQSVRRSVGLKGQAFSVQFVNWMPPVTTLGVGSYGCNRGVGVPDVAGSPVLDTAANGRCGDRSHFASYAIDWLSGTSGGREQGQIV